MKITLIVRNVVVSIVVHISDCSFGTNKIVAEDTLVKMLMGLCVIILFFLIVGIKPSFSGKIGEENGEELAPIHPI